MRIKPLKCGRIHGAGRKALHFGSFDKGSQTFNVQAVKTERTFPGELQTPKGTRKQRLREAGAEDLSPILPLPRKKRMSLDGREAQSFRELCMSLGLIGTLAGPGGGWGGDTGQSCSCGDFYI